MRIELISARVVETLRYLVYHLMSTAIRLLAICRSAAKCGQVRSPVEIFFLAKEKMSMEQEPSMPAVPRPADIDNYNAWAVQNNRPLWQDRLAAPAPVAPMPAPAAEMPPRPATIQDAVAH